LLQRRGSDATHPLREWKRLSRLRSFCLRYPALARGRAHQLRGSARRRSAGCATRGLVTTVAANRGRSPSRPPGRRGLSGLRTAARGRRPRRRRPSPCDGGDWAETAQVTCTLSPPRAPPERRACRGWPSDSPAASSGCRAKHVHGLRLTTSAHRSSHAAARQGARRQRLRARQGAFAPSRVRAA